PPAPPPTPPPPQTTAHPETAATPTYDSKTPAAQVHHTPPWHTASQPPPDRETARTRAGQPGVPARRRVSPGAGPLAGATSPTVHDSPARHVHGGLTPPGRPVSPGALGRDGSVLGCWKAGLAPGSVAHRCRSRKSRVKRAAHEWLRPLG